MSDDIAKSTNKSRKQNPPKYLLLGEILRPHGIRGELRVRILTDYPERINNLEQVYVGKSPNTTTATAYFVQHMRMHQDYGLLKLKSIDDRDAADKLRQLFVMIDLDNAIPLDEGEHYLFELVGLKIQTEDGEYFGELTEVLETGANDVYIIASPKYGEVLLPVIEDVVLNTDVDAGVITVKIPDGLLPS
jgi:16S rRNA processing protein RimM